MAPKKKGMKKPNEKKRSRKLKLNKETIADLSAGRKAANIRGGQADGIMSQKNAICVTPAC